MLMWELPYFFLKSGQKGGVLGVLLGRFSTHLSDIIGYQLLPSRATFSLLNAMACRGVFGPFIVF